jgi:hypothetical protein
MEQEGDFTGRAVLIDYQRDSEQEGEVQRERR